ncbi:MAG: large conductance mechanosensitive channel protein MscL [Ardenticatenaceae bacterium]|nr:large conductance mechanosensitive channel protein MscL [Ardenticatenaceae bacterium]
MLQEFREFIQKGNVMDLAVAVIIGGAFGAIVTSFVNDIITPILGLFTGGIDFSNLFVSLDGEAYATLAAAQEAGAATLNYGLFINAVINFLVIAFVIFMLVRTVNNMQKQEEEAAPPAPPEPSAEEKLLTEIRDLLAR